ncbi:hypothetical protein Tco_0804610 [Tanacetum coccineum]|uniref:Uncharacterized protein n=1 Tax=Tanacetum coccineum TaxID=301880 RepID=A0ABQ5A8N0_9ASTR
MHEPSFPEHPNNLGSLNYFKSKTNMLESSNSGNPYRNMCFLNCLTIRYVHNNIFFSFAIDADLKQFSKKQTLEANLNPSEKALAKSSTTINGDKFSFATAENGATESAFDTPS